MITRKEVRVKKKRILQHENKDELSFNIKGNITKQQHGQEWF